MDQGRWLHKNISGRRDIVRLGSDLLGPRYTESLLEGGGEFVKGFDNFGRLFRQRGGHPLDHFRFVADEFICRHHEGKVIIDVVTEVRQFAV